MQKSLKITILRKLMAISVLVTLPLYMYLSASPVNAEESGDGQQTVMPVCNSTYSSLISEQIKLQPIVPVIEGVVYKDQAKSVMGTDTSGYVSGLCGSNAVVGSDAGNDFVCYPSEADVNATDGAYQQGDSIILSKSCPIRLVAATYPAYWHGGNLNNDNKIDVTAGEWPDIASILTSDQPTAKFEDGKSSPTSDSRCISYLCAPGADCGCTADEGTQGSSMEVNVGSEQAAPEAANQSGSSTSGDIATPGCNCSPADGNCMSGCASGAYPTRIASDVGGTPLAEYFQAPNSTENLSDTDKVGKEGGDYWSCTSGSSVPYQLACLDMPPIWDLFISGPIAFSDCLSKGTCFVKVKFVISVKSMLGRNEMARDPEGVAQRNRMPDTFFDLAQLVINPPDPEKTAELAKIADGEIYVGMNSPVAMDEYVSTPAVVSVCGIPYLATMVYPDYLPGYYEAARAHSTPCNNSSADAENPFCDYKKWREYVLDPKNDGGMDNPSALLGL